MDDNLIAQLELVEATDLADDERRDYFERLVAARCPELTGAEVADLANARTTDTDGRIAADAPPVVMMIPAELAERIETALRLIVERIDRLEGWVRVEGAA
jgi:hypothetical protein